jgi:hypothetical protein
MNVQILQMGLCNDFEIKQYGNEKKAQIKIGFSLNLKKKAQKRKSPQKPV